jgi:hypothetical protein
MYSLETLSLLGTHDTGNVDHALWIFTNQKLFYLCEHLDFGVPHVAPRLFSFLCCVVLLCLFLFVLCHVYPTVTVSLSLKIHRAWSTFPHVAHMLIRKYILLNRVYEFDTRNNFMWTTIDLPIACPHVAHRANSYTRFNSMYFLINICATWGNVDHALWIFTNQKLFYLCEHLDFGVPP